MKNNIELQFFGAIDQVTGSCTLLRYKKNDNTEKLFLVDAGIVQNEGTTNNPIYDVLVYAKKLDGIFITHSHIDHIGLLPQLIEKGFKGKVYCTKATCDLTKIMLEDYLRNNDEFNMVNSMLIIDKINFFCVDQMKDFKFSRTPLSLDNYFICTFIRSSHILGSIGLIFSYKETPTEEAPYNSLTFSGDLGSVGTKEEDSFFLMRNWQTPYYNKQKHTIIIESTYGSTIREKHYSNMERINKLNDLIFNEVVMGDITKIII